MKIQVLIPVPRIAFAGILSCAVICPVYGQEVRVREIGQALPSITSDTVTRAATAVITTPIVITESGNYRLNTNIRAVQGNAIEIQTSFVTLDLNGFHVEALAGSAIVAASTVVFEKIAVINGSVTASQDGLFLAVDDCRIENLQVSARLGRAITGQNCIVRNNTVSRSRVGIDCRLCLVTGNSIAFVTDVGISAKLGSSVLGNRVGFGAGIGLDLDGDTGYATNVLVNNAGGDVMQGVQIGQNLCGTSGICPP